MQPLRLLLATVFVLSCCYVLFADAARNDVVYTTEYHSWFDRLGGSFTGSVLGIFMSLLTPFLFAWNERRAVRRAAVLQEGRGAIVSVDGNLDSCHDGKLIHVVGKALTQAAPLVDKEFNIIGGESLKLQRLVEMYQWEEHKSTRTHKDVVGGGQTTETRYDYKTIWSSTLHNSSSFHGSMDHVNPSEMPFQPLLQESPQVTVGDFDLPKSLVQKISNWQVLPLTEEHLSNSYDLQNRYRRRVTIAENYFYFSDDPMHPQVGDVRVRFQICPATTVSIVAKQAKNTLVPYTTSSGDELELLEVGHVEASSMFSHAESENAVLTWVLRVAFFLLEWLSFALVLGPISVAGDIIPLFGSLLSFGVGLVSLLLATIISSVVIVVVWFGYRVWFFFFGTSSSHRKVK